MVELPKDATGRDIPLAAAAPYGKYGRKATVYGRICDPRAEERGADAAQGVRSAATLHPTPLDSWEKSEKDSDGCISASDICRDREINESGNNMGCEAMVFNYIRQRIRNLRGETHDC